MNATVSGLDQPRVTNQTRLLPVIIWVIVLAGLTFATAAWLTATNGDYRDVSPAVLLVAYSPALAAIFVTSFLRKPDGVRALLTELLHGRARPRWYAIAVLSPVVIALLTVEVLTVAGATPPTAPLVLPTVSTMPALLGPLIAGSIGEELGWRGFAQRRLQTRWGALLAALLVGAVWSLWHLWPILTPVGPVTIDTADILQTFLRLIATAILYAWLYNASGWCLPVVLVAHAGHNLAVDLMPPPVIGSDAGALTMAAIYALAALVVIISTRGRLGQHANGVER